MRLFAFLAAAGLASAHAEWTPGPLRELGRTPGGAIVWERAVSSGDREIRVTGVSFAARDFALRVLDNPPTSRQDLPVALQDAGAVAGVNGGYFHEDFTPLGLVVSSGREIHPFERARLLSGLVIVRDGNPALVRSQAFKAKPPVSEALQAGPWLVEDGKPVSGLNAARNARRTAVATGGRGQWALVVTSACTLAEAADILALPTLAGSWTIRQALNLDGGSSTALSAGSLANLPSWGSVRNYLAIVPRTR